MVVPHGPLLTGPLSTEEVDREEAMGEGRTDVSRLRIVLICTAASWGRITIVFELEAPQSGGGNIQEKQTRRYSPTEAAEVWWGLS